MDYFGISYIYQFSEAAMFGYVQPYIPNLTVGDYEYYRAAYCGLCRSMGKVCGAGANLTLSYDGVFLSLLRMLMTKDSPECERHRCPYSPLVRKNMLTESPDIDFSAGAMSTLAALKLEDDIIDEEGLKKLCAILCRLPAKKWVKRADEQDAGIVQSIRDKLALFYTAEESNSDRDFSDSGIDECAEAFGEVVGMLAARGIEFENYAIAYSIGRHVGRWIYCIDALDDFNEDVKKGRYNPYLAMLKKTSLDDNDKAMIRDAVRCEADRVLSALDLIDFEGNEGIKAILYNIACFGMQYKTEAILKQTNKKERKTDERPI